MIFGRAAPRPNRMERARMAVRQRGKARGERSKAREGQKSKEGNDGTVFSILEKFKNQRTVWIAVIGELFEISN